MRHLLQLYLVLTQTILARAQSLTIPTQSLDLGPLQSELSSITNILPSVTPHATLPTNLPTPPPSLLNQLHTAIPSSVLGELTNSKSLAALASDFQNGNTPDWYSSLPTGARSYFAEVGTVITSSASDTGSLPTGLGLGPGPVGTETGGSQSSTYLSGGAQSSLTSSALAGRPAPTGPLVEGALAVVGGLWVVGGL